MKYRKICPHYTSYYKDAIDGYFIYYYDSDIDNSGYFCTKIFINGLLTYEHYDVPNSKSTTVRFVNNMLIYYISNDSVVMSDVQFKKALPPLTILSQGFYYNGGGDVFDTFPDE